MLIVTRYKHQTIDKTTIKIHEFKYNKILKVYENCCESFLEKLASRHKHVYFVDVNNKADLDIKYV